MTDVLIDTDELATRIRSGQPVRILDVRWSLAQPDGRPAYLEAHVPGAVYVDLDRELAAHGAPTDGRHPLPPIADLECAARRWGLADGDPVVVYDADSSLAAARAWWLLRHAGVADVRLLDGGLAAWLDGGHPVESGEHDVAPGDVRLAYGALPVIDIDEAADIPGHGVLLDARAAERYRGEVEPVDPVAGHIPGALSAPTGANVDARGRFRTPAELRARFDAIGATGDAPIAVYCGSGVTAAHEIAALAIAGRSAALYPGSWSQWSNHPDRPVATGDAPTE